MEYQILLGEPEMMEFWTSLCKKVKEQTASADEISQYKKIGKAMRLISKNPSYPGLHTHDITEMTEREGIRIWQSYLENNKPAAGRIYWAYGPDRGYITILGVEPHPNTSNKNAYKHIRLSKMGRIIENTEDKNNP